MKLSQNGIIALEQWLWLGTQYPYIDLISFVIMPNHVHGIIYIVADFYNNYVGTVVTVPYTNSDRSPQ